MVTLLIVVGIAILCFSHYHAYRCGERRADRELYRRYFRPLLRRHNRLVKQLTEGICDDTATAQQKNVKLVAVNATLRGKAIWYLLAYREATRHRRRKSKLDQIERIVTFMMAASQQLDDARRATARK